jgi:signal transduction histidine kinase
VRTAPSRTAEGGEVRAGRSTPPYGAAVQPALVPHRGDLLVVGYAVVAQLEVHVWYPDLPVPPRLLLLASVLALLARRRLPRAAPLICATGAATTSVWLPGNDVGVAIVGAGIAAALLGRQGRESVPALVVLLAVAVGHVLADPVQDSDLVTAPLVLLAVAGVSAALFRASRQLDELRARTAEVETRGRDVQAALLTDERRRVARELHDVVSHHLTVAALQASAARVQLTAHGSTRTVLDALDATEAAGRQALTDLRPLLDLVGGDAGLAPSPGLADLPALV